MDEKTGKYIVGSVSIVTLGAICISCHTAGIDGTVTTAIVGTITAIVGGIIGLNIGMKKGE